MPAITMRTTPKSILYVQTESTMTLMALRIGQKTWAVLPRGMNVSSRTMACVMAFVRISRLIETIAEDAAVSAHLVSSAPMADVVNYAIEF